MTILRKYISFYPILNVEKVHNGKKRKELESQIRGVKAKIALDKADKQGRIYSRLLQ